MNFKLNQLIPLIFQILLHIGQMFHVMPNLLIIGKNDTLSDREFLFNKIIAEYHITSIDNTLHYLNIILSR